MDVIVDRCAGLDVHKNTVMAAVRKPDGVGGRSEVVREFSTFTADLVRLGEWLAGERVSQVVMEAPGSRGDRCCLDSVEYRHQLVNQFHREAGVVEVGRPDLNGLVALVHHLEPQRQHAAARFLRGPLFCGRGARRRGEDWFRY